MSKKQASLFKFFTPPSNSKKLKNDDTPQTPKSTRKSDNDRGTPKRPLVELSPELSQMPKRRKRINVIPDSSEEEDDSNNTTEKSLSNRFSFQAEVDEAPTTPKSKTKDKSIQIEQRTVTNNQTNDSVRLPHQTVKEQQFAHHGFDHLQPNHIRDKYNRRPSDPNYDPKTLFVPQKFLNEQTPAMKQWWEMKQDYFDCVLFFKVGKFYELYHMDAVVGVEELGFSYMKGSFAHSGFPEQAYGRMAAALVEKGYKVARVEQTETPEMMQERNKASIGKKASKVVRREICQLTTKATQVYNTQDSNPTNPGANYLLAISEQISAADTPGENPKCMFGVCFVETSLAEFYIAEFEDDIHRSSLHLLISHFPPSLILLSRAQKLSSTTQALLNAASLADVKKEYLNQRKEFLEADQTINWILKHGYFDDEDGNIKWPSALRDMIEGDERMWEPQREYLLCLSALGAIIWYLHYSKVDDQLLTMQNFRKYQPTMKHQEFTPNSFMILDAITLYHLRVVDMEGSLYNKLDQCKTPFGKRLLRKWLCSPLCHVASIKERQDAIMELSDMQSYLPEIQKMLKELPDLERLLARIHALGCKVRNESHPDSRAIFFESKTYNKKKILDFCTVLDSFEKVLEINKQFAKTNTALLTRITQVDPVGDFPEIRDNLKYFKLAFDHEEAKKLGIILPVEGKDPNYTEVMNEIKDIEAELQLYRKEQEKIFGCSVTYFGTDKKRYQLSVPQAKAKNAGREYHLEGATKGAKPLSRFSTAETKLFLARMMAAEEKKSHVLENTAQILFQKFSKCYDDWIKAVNYVSILDVLIALTLYSNSDNEEMCLPEVEEPINSQSFINIVEGRHPCLSSPNFIPNSTSIGTNGNSNTLILTGPNMGGKSTLMRQVALISILAQIGCFVPAEKCKITVVDRIFTRMGARDDIIEGSSTFLVELQETNSILKYGTPNSLALLDEFGRGTSTHDGTSMAGGVAYYLAKSGIRTIFSTHYHQLVASYLNLPNITLTHMMCEVKEREFDSKNPYHGDDSVTFLYKMANGSCPKSYGYNAARLAGLDDRIIELGLNISNNFDMELSLARTFIKFSSMAITEDNVIDILADMGNLL